MAEDRLVDRGEELLLQLGEVALWVLVEFLETRFAAEFHGGAIVLVEVGFTHAAEFLA